MSITIEGFTNGPAATNSFLLWDDRKHGMIIDTPPASFNEMTDAIEREEIKPTALVLTHTHWDHTADVNLFKERFGDDLLIYVHPDDEYRLKDPMKYLEWPIPLEMDPTKPDRYLRHGNLLRLGEMSFGVLHTPGHTEGSICLYGEERSIIFVGDVLFSGSVGRTDLPGGHHQRLTSSIREHLLPLPEKTRVYPGHGPATTIGVERETNPFVGV
ncbi:MAG: MBL fold metallo-hydrolase [Chlorobi bacterium]|nr:MBL fold metallo-hydrolase [Chlorobiota bacterium]